ncbi:DUF3574 domain-containing protein [Yersinia bercovieri]|uniref:DUF3574 domain-containing protein n=2 Tax=Yersinia bercovieri TaxID=634 RepID=A0A2G4U144_YERBE|nr:DUF3574 domain-containing protein [Yersinia bercovieri]EEQ07116.1 hypothetical protein yberc0001_5350 [Yersinia bercovieri ATCC 43970]MDN0103951.1 DUF3574 domain-containing protein [Yersinia bercovieri]PHZ26960.1 DUF3574 domain-containing protein [Yersinia bercovieri]QKJ06588.1 DUF3574 domain-containing protein [Yersinia bercovieri ATCC 43970]CFQ45124.1 30S ribosomal protein S3 [Yersinia bercovieri]
MDKCINRFHYRAVLFTGMIAAGILLSGCVDRPVHSDTATAKVSSPACIKGEPMAQTTLYFGLNRPHGPAISTAEWHSFVDNDVTSRFKEGLTIIDAKGQWLGNDGRVAKESSKALVLIHKNDKDADIEALRSRYKQQFAQESVMRVDTNVCVDF